MKTGRYNIAQLLTSSEVEQIIIPELQRDYVWEERNVKNLLVSILENYKSKIEQSLIIKDTVGNNIEPDIIDYLNEEYMRLRYSTRIGFIYAYHERTLAGQYYLIDGQQRITTIFLVLLALYRRSNNIEIFRKLYFDANVPKLDYKVREVAHYFLVDFINFELTKVNNSDTFKESSRYYCEYDKDVTAMTIYKNYYDIIVPMLAEYDVYSLIDYIENYIEFNYFDTNMSEQGEKLYLYMNSRGEALSPQEKIKSIIIRRSKNKLEAGKLWEDWQNFFWRTKSPNDENADRGFFEFLKWAVIIHMCKYEDTKTKETKSRNRTEEIEDYIRIEKEASKKIQQTDWICTYISTNDSFTFEWLQKVESAVESLYNLLLTNNEFKEYNFQPKPWFSGCNETIEYFTLLGLLYYILSFKITNSQSINTLRVAMYLKNLKSEYTLRRNPDNAIIRILHLIDWMANNDIKDIRLLGKYAIRSHEDFKYVLRKEDLRWGYYQIDWQNAQSICVKADEIGDWEAFFWKITNNNDLNRFLRGNHDFIIKVLQRGILPPDQLLSLFIKKIYNCRDKDEPRQNLLKFGDISIYDGGSSNIAPYYWMSRWCLLANDRDETYWYKFMNGENSDTNASIVVSYLLNYTGKMTSDPLLKALGRYCEYMHQKYFLWDREHGQLRVIILQEKQASKNRARELCVQHLHHLIPNSWVWEHNFCVVNFDKDKDGQMVSLEDHTAGFYIDIWYDWEAAGGKWYCRIGHREQDLSDTIIKQLQESSDKLLDAGNSWEVEKAERINIKTKLPIYIEKPSDDYFKGTECVKSLFYKLWNMLTNTTLN